MRANDVLWIRILDFFKIRNIQILKFSWNRFCTETEIIALYIEYNNMTSHYWERTTERADVVESLAKPGWRIVLNQESKNDVIIGSNDECSGYDSWRSAKITFKFLWHIKQQIVRVWRGLFTIKMFVNGVKQWFFILMYLPI